MEDIRKEEYVDEYRKCREEFEMALIKTELPEVSKRINGLLSERSLARQVFGVDEISPTQNSVSYQLPEEFISPVWILPGLGYVAQDYMELTSEEIFFNLFTVQAAKNWPMKYEEEGRTDVLFNAIKQTAKNLQDYEEEAMWRVIIPAVTTSFDGAGILPPRPANIFQMPDGDRAAGYLSKELINRMIVGAKRVGKNLTEILISPEDLADIREWTDTDVDEATRSQIFQAAGAGDIWGIKLREVEFLGVRGKYNINDKTSEFGPFKGSSESNSYNDYAITHGNIMDENGNLVIPGETQVIGLCDGHKDMLKLANSPYIAHYDWNLIRMHKTGFFGWEKLAIGCLDSTYIQMGVIDRYSPSSFDKSLAWFQTKEAEKKNREEKERQKFNKSISSNKTTIKDFIDVMVGLLRNR